MLQASSNCSLRGKTDGIFWKRLHEVGLQLLEQAKTFSWAEVSHCGFRPMNALGHNHAMDAWNDARSKLPRKWPAAQFHTDSLLFPCDGLGAKVLTDRILEVLELCELVTPESFLARFAAIPIIPKVGGCARMVSLLHHRTMLLGSDLLPCKHPPQSLLTIQRRLQRQLQLTAKTTKREQLQLTWSATENVLCCFAKVLDSVLGVGNHARYQAA